MTLLAVLIFMVANCTFTTAEDERRTLDISIINRLNYGIVFKPITPFDLTSDFWGHLFQIVLPPSNLRRGVIHSIRRNNSRPAVDHLMGAIQATLTLQMDYVSTFMADIYELIPDLSSNPRKKSTFPRRPRSGALCDICGRAYGAIFGLASIDDVNLVLQIAQEGIENQNSVITQVINSTNALSSYVTITNHRVDTLVEMFKNEYLARIIIETRLLRTAEEEETEFNIISEVLKLSTKFTYELITLQDLRAGLISLKHGILVADILTPTAILNVIHYIEITLIEDNYPFRLCDNTAESVYKMKDFYYFRVDNILFVHLNFKLSPKENHFILYQVQAYNFAVPDKTHTTVISNIPKYVALPSDPSVSTVYMQFDERPILSDNLYLQASSLVALRDIDEATCITALIRDDFRGVQAFCNITLNLFQARPQILIVDDNTILFQNIAYYNLTCHHQPALTFIPGCELCTIKVGCKCYLSTQAGTYTAPFVKCSEFDVNSPNTISNMSHLINLALLSEFFEAEQLLWIAGDATSTKHVNITIPSLQVYDATFEAELASFNADSILLRGVGNSTRINGKIFQNPADRIRFDISANRIQWGGFSFSVFSSSYWLNLFTTVLAIALAIGLFLVHRRVATLTTALLLLQRPAAAQAQTTAKTMQLVFDYFKTTPAVPTASPASFLFMPTIEQSLNPLDIISLIAFFTMTLYVAYRYFLSRHVSHQFDVYLEIGNNTTFTRLRVKTLRHSPAHYKFHSDTLAKNLAVTGIRCPRFTFSWPSLTITHVITGVTCSIPERYVISYLTAIRMHEILASPFYLLLWSKGADSTQYELIALEDNNWSAQPPPNSTNSKLLAVRYASNKLYPPLLPNYAENTLPGPQQA